MRVKNLIRFEIETIDFYAYDPNSNDFTIAGYFVIYKNKNFKLKSKSKFKLESKLKPLILYLNICSRS